MAQMGKAARLALLAAVLHAALAHATSCPYMGLGGGGGESPHALGGARRGARSASERELLASMAAQINYDDVKADLRALFTDSKDFWPADYGNYGPLMIRLAWHASGSYRQWDGRGGVDGGRQRFDPERSWPDNTNLDKARTLLQPIKVKYGPGLSWGDLIALAGTTAIESMGGPVLGFCGGRIDDTDGFASLPLGPNAEQEAVAPCLVPGNCSSPTGVTVMGLIYVNPAGPFGMPDPAGSVGQIRSSFGRMGHNDSETVALIGGGHAFGKAHGACLGSPGLPPNEDPEDPWHGTCGTGPMQGKGENTFTAGFEGPWTDSPTVWTNDYFHNLVSFDWHTVTSPGGSPQWEPTQRPGGPVPAKTIMLTTDIALLHDPIYARWVHEFLNLRTLNRHFAHAWYRLITADMGPVTRCLGNDVPPAQDFQLPLPDPPAVQPDWRKVKAAIRKAMVTSSTAVAPDTLPNGKPSYSALFSHLAWQCASTFRQTDYKGGCNGARIRFSPQKDWPGNEGLDRVLAVLKPVKQMFPSKGDGSLSWADLIVLAGTTAVESAAGFAPGRRLSFCGGRTDATDGGDTEYLAPRQYSSAVVGMPDRALVAGLDEWEWVALQGGLRSPSQQQRMGYSGSWGGEVNVLSNRYFTTLLGETWVAQNSSAGKAEYKAAGKDVYMTEDDLAVKFVPELLAAAQEYAADESLFLTSYARAWTKMMNADRFKGPAGSVCPREPCEEPSQVSFAVGSWQAALRALSGHAARMLHRLASVLEGI